MSSSDSSTTITLSGGVVDDVGEFVRVQAGVQGVDDRAHGGDREVQLEVFGLVPQQGGDAVALGHAEHRQRAGKSSGATGAGAQRGAGARARGRRETTSRSAWNRSARSTTLVTVSG